MIQYLLSSFLELAIAAVPCAFAGLWYKLSRDFYFNGMKAFAIAFAMERLISLGFPNGPSSWMMMVLLAPVLEEGWRTIAISARPTLIPTQWLAFGFGFGSLETVSKFFDAVVERSSNVWTYLVPIAPFALHLTLSLIAYLLYRRAWPIARVFAVSAVLHVMWNWSVRNIVENGGANEVVEISAQLVVLALATASVCWLAFRTVPSTTPPVSANTSP